MSTLSLVLFQKTDRLEATPEGFTDKLTFLARLPAKEKLKSHLGEEVKRGFVELVTASPRFEDPTITFTESVRDTDTGEIYPATISFYALIPEKIFDILRSAPVTAGYKLNLSTELMGAIQFSDPLGFEKIWNIGQQRSVKVPYFDFSVEHDPSDA